MAKENTIEKTATRTVRLCPSVHVGQLTLFLSSPNDSLTYSTMPAIVIIIYWFESILLLTFLELGLSSY